MINPTTDSGVIAQALIVITATIILAIFLRRKRPWMILAIGAGVMALAFMSLRALH